VQPYVQGAVTFSFNEPFPNIQRAQLDAVKAMYDATCAPFQAPASYSGSSYVDSTSTVGLCKLNSIDPELESPVSTLAPEIDILVSSLCFQSATCTATPRTRTRCRTVIGCPGAGAPRGRRRRARRSRACAATATATWWSSRSPRRACEAGAGQSSNL
jgi:hypothetical protein